MILSHSLLFNNFCSAMGLVYLKLKSTDHCSFTKPTLTRWIQLSCSKNTNATPKIAKSKKTATCRHHQWRQHVPSLYTTLTTPRGKSTRTHFMIKCLTSLNPKTNLCKTTLQYAVYMWKTCMSYSLLNVIAPMHKGKKH